MPTVSGQLTHNGTHPAGVQIDFRHLGVLVGSAITDANGYYAITLAVGNHTAKVGADLCTPNPISVADVDLLQDLTQA